MHNGETNKKKNRFFPSWLIKPSTLEFVREGRHLPGYGVRDLLHGYIYGRWTYLYIAIGTGRHPLARLYLRLAARLPKGKSKPAAKTRSVADGYHGKVLPLESARRLIQVGEDVRLENLEKVIPYARARDLVLQNPDAIAVLDCPCRAAKEDPCLPLDVCLVVGEPFVSFVTEHHPQRSRRITPEQAVAILAAETDRGHVHHAFFKDAMLGRYYAICSCCKCCCGAMQAHRSGTPMLASSGYLARVDEVLCTGCETCLETCQFNALQMDGFTATIDEAACMGCGVCAAHCPQEAISLERSTEKGIPLEIAELLQAASLKAGQ
jgi:NAD-dependent dihydropyrimidine dehydrogenase PreA subunit